MKKIFVLSTNNVERERERERDAYTVFLYSVYCDEYYF